MGFCNRRKSATLVARARSLKKTWNERGKSLRRDRGDGVGNERSVEVAKVSWLRKNGSSLTVGIGSIWAPRKAATVALGGTYSAKLHLAGRSAL